MRLLSKPICSLKRFLKFSGCMSELLITDWLWTNLCFELQTLNSQSSLPKENKNQSMMDCNIVKKKSINIRK